MTGITYTHDARIEHLEAIKRYCREKRTLTRDELKRWIIKVRRLSYYVADRYITESICEDVIKENGGHLIYIFDKVEE